MTAPLSWLVLGEDLAMAEKGQAARCLWLGLRPSKRPRVGRHILSDSNPIWTSRSRTQLNSFHHFTETRIQPRLGLPMGFGWSSNPLTHPHSNMSPEIGDPPSWQVFEMRKLLIKHWILGSSHDNKTHNIYIYIYIYVSAKSTKPARHMATLLVPARQRHWWNHRAHSLPHCAFQRAQQSDGMGGRRKLGHQFVGKIMLKPLIHWGYAIAKQWEGPETPKKIEALKNYLVLWCS